jgi:hypothetical protein
MRKLQIPKKCTSVTTNRNAWQNEETKRKTSVIAVTMAISDREEIQGTYQVAEGAIQCILDHINHSNSIHNFHMAAVITQAWQEQEHHHLRNNTTSNSNIRGMFHSHTVDLHQVLLPIILCMHPQHLLRTECI